jgi:signal transduction histidine kinase
MSDSSPQSDILVVDDTPANLRLLSQMLTDHGHKVRAALSGSHALAAAQAAPPDLILLDIRMPEMDGYEVCARLKADERTRDIPVLFISALGEADDKIKAFTAGGVDYITKPFQLEEVLARVQTHLALRHLYRRLQATNAELLTRLEELQERNQDLDAFAHTVAHDVRNPVSQVVGFSQLLRESDETLSAEERDEALYMLVRLGNQINNIIEELLLLSEVRKVDVRPVPLAMGGIVAQARRRLSPLIEESRAEIILPLAWPNALGYPPWVEEVWVNYLSNGCKYGGTPPRLELGGETLPGGTARFWMRDGGTGISPEDQARLFAPFTRLGQVHVGGHGLGLSIVHRIIDKLGGQVGVESDGLPGHGSLFYFILPAAPPTAS